MRQNRTHVVDLLKKSLLKNKQRNSTDFPSSQTLIIASSVWFEIQFVRSITASIKCNNISFKNTTSSVTWQNQLYSYSDHRNGYTLKYHRLVICKVQTQYKVTVFRPKFAEGCICITYIMHIAHPEQPALKEILGEQYISDALLCILCVQTWTHCPMIV